MYHKRDRCAICGNTELKPILQYGEVPLAGSFPTADEVENEKLYNLDILFCDVCGLLQTDSIIDPDTLFRDYRYMSSIGLSKHFEGVAQHLKDYFNLDSSNRILEIGSNDGVLLVPLKALGLNAVGFEPAVNISQIAEDKGVDVINDYFSEEKAKEYVHEKSIDLAVSNNCFAHIEDLHSIVKGLKYVLKENGHFVFEVSYVRDLIEQMQYDNIYHEHIYYYTLRALAWLFNDHRMTVVDYDFIPIHNGSIRVYVKNTLCEFPDKVKELIGIENSEGLTSLPWYSEFSNKVKNHIEMVHSSIDELKADGKTIAGYGASGRANMICNAADLTKDKIDYIVDESPQRCGRCIAGKGIPIVGKDMLESHRPDYIVIFAWNFAKMIIDKLQGQGYKFIVFFPEYKVVETSDELELGI